MSPETCLKSSGTFETFEKLVPGKRAKMQWKSPLEGKCQWYCSGEKQYG